MADYIEVDFTALEQDIAQLRETITGAQSDIDAMFDTLKELDGRWEGPAHTAFEQQVTEDKQIFDALLDTIRGIVNSMEDAKKMYQQCEAGVRDEIEKISI